MNPYSISRFDLSLAWKITTSLEQSGFRSKAKQYGAERTLLHEKANIISLVMWVGSVIESGNPGSIFIVDHTR